MTPTHDTRRRRLTAWANANLGAALDWQPVSVDASFRRYFRAVWPLATRHAAMRPLAACRMATCRAPDGAAVSWIAMDAPPERENNAAFVSVAELMAAAGLNVPRVLAFDAEAGFLLLTDLGSRTFLDAFDSANVDALFTAAIDALLAWQMASVPGVLPDYNRASLAAEMALFRDWYLVRHLRYRPSAAEDRALDDALAFILDNVCAQPKVFVHRDYMPRNLMISDPLAGILDFQDARFGPVTYDIASLFKDAFVSWPAARTTAWARQYWEAARARDLPVGQDWPTFCRDLALMGAQRHLKILGLFARIAYRDGKPRYLTDTPRFIGYLQPVVATYPALAGLQLLLAKTRS
jgi:aminoglycoside/choline kinase family phosphotransferase